MCLSEASSSFSCEDRGFELIDFTNCWIVVYQPLHICFCLKTDVRFVQVLFIHPHSARNLSLVY